MYSKLTLTSLLFVIGIASQASAEEALFATRVATGLSRPVYATFAPGQTDQLYVVEQHSGRIKTLDLNTGVIDADPFLRVPRLSTGGEQGLLGLAFHPEYETNGKLYVNFTESNRRTNVREYTANADRTGVIEDSEVTVLRFNQPQGNHNGGWIGFSPVDNYLYVATGDGGGADDQGSGHTASIGNSQDITNNLLGKMLRLDINSDAFPEDANRNYAVPASNPFVNTDGDDEIWSYGLRNPWRASFDRANGDLYIGDVGQNRFEEIDYQPASSAGGENYGWRLREGTIRTPGVGGDAPAGHVEPIHEYTHTGAPDGGFSVTGGYMYRGPIESLQGEYFFADFVSNQVWSLRHDGSKATSVTNWTESIFASEGSVGSIASFAEDAEGNLFIVSLDGDVFRFEDTAPVETIVPAGSDWKYLDDGSDQGTAWRASAFDDANWAEGPAQLGYGENDQATDIAEGDPRNPTAYFRHTFEYDGQLDINSLSVGLLYDDGAAVYLNGEEVVRTDNLAPDAAFDDFANFNGARARGGAAEDTFERFAVAADRLVVGTNVLAVELHQHSRSSSDMSFDLRLAALLNRQAGIAGDFDGNGMLDALDIDALTTAVRSGQGDLAFDLNGDDRLDDQDRIFWIESLRNTWIGDSNLDGEFGTGDFVFVFQAAEYEDGIADNSTWAEGDWNGDGEFDSGDFVYAFRSRGFEAGPRPVFGAATVPEPTPLLLPIAMISVLLLRRRVVQR